MDKKLLPSRKERHKKEGYVNWYAALFLYGVYWALYFITPNNLKSIWTVFLTAIVSIGLTVVLEKMQLPVFLKWLIAIILCIIGATLHFGLM